MMDKKHLKTVEKIVEDFFTKTTLPYESKLNPQDEKTVLIEIETPEARVLIGEGGQTLVEIQQILNRIVKKQIEALEDIYLDLDINKYKSNKVRYLAEIAKSAADEVLVVGREKVLGPMSSFERRIIHMELANRDDIKTESMGEEPTRRIVIRPATFLD